MKKTKGMLTLLCVCIACLLLLTACSGKLSAPTSFRLNGDTLMLQWNKVIGANAYVVEIGDDISVTTRTNSFSLEDLEPGEHIVRVRAISYGKEYEDSEFAEYKFTREKESGLRYKLNGSRDAYQLVGIGTAEGDVVMDDYYRGKPVTSIAKAALRRCGKITSFVVGKNVTTIGDNAFYACGELTSITIPEGVVSIGNGAFQSCLKLENVVLPSTLTAVNPYTFSMCKGLKSVTLGSGVTLIDKYAFSDCILLEAIEIPDAVQNIGEYAFSHCEMLKDVKLGASVKSVGDYAFFNCAALRTVLLNNQLEVINVGAFQSTDIASLVIPDSVKNIGIVAFASCHSLTDVKLGSGLTAIGYNVFADTGLVNNCTEDVLVIDNWIISLRNKDLETYTVPENIVGIADAAFAGSTKIETLRLNNVKYIGNGAFQSSGSLWEVIMGDALVSIGEYAFAYSEFVTDVTLGEGLETIGRYAFYNCGRLEDAGIDLPKTVKQIGNGAFENTRLFYSSKTALVYVDDWVVGYKNQMASNLFIKEGTRGIADYAFYNMMLMDGKLYIPDSVEIIGRCAFYQNNFLQETNLPANLKYIGEFAFAECTMVRFNGWETFVIPENCEYIGQYAFRECQYIVGVVIPGATKYIGKAAFYKCANLGLSSLKLDENSPPLEGEVILSDGIEYIGPSAFYQCVGLQEIVLPNSLKELGDRAFYQCAGLKKLTIGTGLDHIQPYTFDGCAELGSVVIPGNVKKISKSAFRMCEKLENIVLSEGVEEVLEYAFYRCIGVKYLTIADSVKTIGDFAFRGMSDVKSIQLTQNLTYVGKLAFFGAYNATIYLDSEEIPETWSKRWNATFMPVVKGAVMSEDNSYVVSCTPDEDLIENLSSYGELTEPGRRGYTFVGWSTTENSEDCQYASLIEVPEGTTVYSVWTEAVEEAPEETPEASTPADATT